MSRPVPGKPYTIVKGDTLWDISASAYGSSWRWEEIWEANKTTLRSGDPNLIYPGEVLWLPNDSVQEMIFSLEETSSEELTEVRNPYKIHIEVEGVSLPVSSSNVLLTLDKPANGWTASLGISEDSPFRELLRPYGYQKCKVWVGNYFIGETLIYGTSVTGNPDTCKCTLKGFVPTVDIIDSLAVPPYEGNNVTLSEWVTKLVKPFGIDVTSEIEDDDKPISRVKIGKTEKIYDHLNKLADERGVIISNTDRGGLRLFRLSKDINKPVAYFSDKTGMVLESISASFDGRGRFRKTIGWGKGPRKNLEKAIVDEAITRNRLQGTSIPEVNEDEIERAVQVLLNRTIESSLALVIPTNEWYSMERRLYLPGDVIALKSKRIWLDEYVNLIVRAVSYTMKPGGVTLDLTVVLPSVYTDEEVRDPWTSVQ